MFSRDDIAALKPKAEDFTTLGNILEVLEQHYRLRNAPHFVTVRLNTMAKQAHEIQRELSTRPL